MAFEGKHGTILFANGDNAEPQKFTLAFDQVVVASMDALTNEECESLRCGDIVVKRDASGEHAYIVSFYKAGVGMCLTYTDCENVETVAYNCVEGEWTYDSTDVTHIGQ